MPERYPTLPLISDGVTHRPLRVLRGSCLNLPVARR